MSDVDPFLGRTIANGRIQLLEVIGGGGMGRVYKSLDKQLSREVAVKVLHPEHQSIETAKVYFEREAQSASKLNHPNIINIIDFGEEQTDGTLYLVMEYVQGRNLADLIEEEFPLSTERIVRITNQILMALEQAHYYGIIHRDLKPENIMVQEVPGNPDLVKVLDFGVAKAIEVDAAGPMTIQGLVMGTPHFMSPEQALGHEIDQRSDLYSVGAILYQVLTTELPFDGRMVMNVLAKVISEKPEPPSKRRPDLQIDPRLEQICLQALRKNAEARFHSAAEFREALANLDRFAPSTEPDSEITELESVDLEPFRENQRTLQEAQAIADGQVERSHREMVVLAVELRLSQALSNTDRARLRQLFRAAVEQQFGDAASQVRHSFTALFQQRSDLRDAPSRALQAAMAFLASVQEVQAQGTAALAAGKVVIPEADISAAYGAAIDTALDLASVAEPGVLLADASIAALDTELQLVPSQSNEVFFVALGESGHKKRRTLPVQVNLPFVGRVEEMDYLSRLLNRLSAGEGFQLAITGPMGSGKSRVLERLGRIAEDKKFLVLTAPAERYEGELPALPLIRICRSALEEIAYEDPAEAFSSLGLPDSQVQTLIYLLRGVPTPGHANFWADTLTVALSGMLRQLSQDEPVVVIVDNIESCDLLTYRVLTALADALDEQRVGIIVAGATEEETTMGFVEAYRELPLPPIPVQVLDSYLQQAFPSLTPALREAVIGRSLGRPLFFELLLEHLKQYKLHSTGDLPLDPKQVLVSRLESIPESARRLAAIAGALGRSFPLDALAGSCPKSWDLRGNLRIIGQARLLTIHEDEDRVWLRFDPPMLADFCLAQVQEETRIQIHNRIASYYERSHGDNPHPDHEYQWARQLEFAGVHEGALKIYGYATDNAVQTFGSFSALSSVDSLLNVAISRFDQSSLGFQRVLLKAAFIMIQAGHLEDSLELLLEYEPAFGADPETTSEYYAFVIECLVGVGRFNEALNLGQNIREPMQEANGLLQAHFHYHLGMALQKAQQLRAAAQEAKRTIQIIQSLGQVLPPSYRKFTWSSLLLVARIQLHHKNYPRRH